MNHVLDLLVAHLAADFDHSLRVILVIVIDETLLLLSFDILVVELVRGYDLTYLRVGCGTHVDITLCVRHAQLDQQLVLLIAGLRLLFGHSRAADGLRERFDFIFKVAAVAARRVRGDVRSLGYSSRRLPVLS